MGELRLVWSGKNPGQTTYDFKVHYAAFFFLRFDLRPPHFLSRDLPCGLTPTWFVSQERKRLSFPRPTKPYSPTIIIPT
jgi:hypothetical protein